jgi:hypothetical protein
VNNFNVKYTLRLAVARQRVYPISFTFNFNVYGIPYLETYFGAEVLPPIFGEDVSSSKAA